MQWCVVRQVGELEVKLRDAEAKADQTNALLSAATSKNECLEREISARQVTNSHELEV